MEGVSAGVDAHAFRLVLFAEAEARPDVPAADAYVRSAGPLRPALSLAAGHLAEATALA